MKITVLGIDAAFANMGYCRAVLDINSLDVKVDALHLVKTSASSSKTVRKASDDLRRATELHTNLVYMCKQAPASTGSAPVLAFCEVPHGSQSARASWGLGIVVGVLSASPVQLIQLTALEVKLATVGKKDATKEEMIEWAHSKFPEANWLKSKGRLIAANEHLADAVASVFAGIKTTEFTIMLEALRIAHAPKRRHIQRRKS